MSIDFLVTSLIVIVSPGTGVLYTLAAGLSRGSRASVVAAFGCTLGILPHMAAAIMGLAALLHTSALAFQTLKYLGVAYLLYMAWNALREQGALRVEKEVGTRSARQVIITAILINILNPKLSIFFFRILAAVRERHRITSAHTHVRAEHRVHALDVRSLRWIRAVRRLDPRARHLASAGVDVDAANVRRRQARACRSLTFTSAPKIQPRRVVQVTGHGPRPQPTRPPKEWHGRNAARGARRPRLTASIDAALRLRTQRRRWFKERHPVAAVSRRSPRVTPARSPA